MSYDVGSATAGRGMAYRGGHDRSDMSLGADPAMSPVYRGGDALSATDLERGGRRCADTATSCRASAPSQAMEALNAFGSAEPASGHMDVEESWSMAPALQGISAVEERSDTMAFGDEAEMAAVKEDMPAAASFRSLGAGATQSFCSLSAAETPSFRSLSAAPSSPTDSMFRSCSMGHSLAAAPPPATAPPPPAYVPASPAYSPVSPAYSPASPTYFLASAAEPRLPAARAPTLNDRTSAEADDPWLRSICSGFETSGLDGALAAFDAQLREQPSLQGKPSTYILACEVLHSCGAPSDACADMLFNVLEISLADFRTCRVVAYHLLTLDRFNEAVKLLELVVELAPAEPHSHTDIAFARLLRLRRYKEMADSAARGVVAGLPTSLPVASPICGLDYAASEMRQVVESLTKVLVDTDWPTRFAEIEWPCLILLSWAIAWAEVMWPTLRGTLWPEAQLPSTKFRLGGDAGPLLDVFVWLGWDTDHTDVDLHVKEPTGEEVCYSNNRSRTTGAAVSRDFTQGFGPEVYTLPSAPAGTYKVETNYYANNQGTAVTGSTSAVIWSVQRMGHFGEERMQFSSVRLTRYKQRQQVLKLEVSNQSSSHT